MSRLLLFTSLLGLTYAQFPPKPEGLTVLKSKFHENVTISFKEPRICETTRGVKSYSGYVHLPPGFLDDGPGGEAQDYPINTFFWFFEARKSPETAPLAIWLNGGPGGSSMIGLLEENGPCFVGSDSQTTYLNPWSWNNEVNMLYIDQPTQVGFSYDVPTNCTVRVTQDEGSIYETTPANFSDVPVPETNLTSYVGTFGSQQVPRTANTTRSAAHALWHFAQTWFGEFPHYRPENDRVSVWAESYGGHYGPGVARFFQEQNEKIANGSIGGDAKYLHLDTLGIVNGLIDLVVQYESFISFPFNNTYGIQIFNASHHSALLSNWTRPGGCRSKLQSCQSSLSPLSLSSCDAISDACASQAWDAYQSLPFSRGGRAWFDIAHPPADPFPPPTSTGYLLQAQVQAALGVPVNHTKISSAVQRAFEATRDVARGGFLAAVADLLDQGVKVALVYGDRDYACNWVGGEAASLAVPWEGKGGFRGAGYAPLVLSPPSSSSTPEEEGEEIGGLTRQYGNLSFTRVFGAGHEVPAYAPHAAYDIFVRATFGLDVATGKIKIAEQQEGYATSGPPDAWGVRHAPPEMPKPRCYVLKPESCTDEIWETVVSGEAVVRDWYVVEDDEEGKESEVKPGPGLGFDGGRQGVPSKEEEEEL
ncbi:carboxypeptidase C [Camillea tinctor]|nr:carboxypeptidase C [Camillea tinctor]